VTLPKTGWLAFASTKSAIYSMLTSRFSPSVIRDPRDLGKQAQDIKEKKIASGFMLFIPSVRKLANYMQKVSSTDAANPGWFSVHVLQLGLCEEADIVIAIGPKVADAYKVALRHCRKPKDVITMTPDTEQSNANFFTYNAICTSRIIIPMLQRTCDACHPNKTPETG